MDFDTMSKKADPGRWATLDSGFQRYFYRLLREKPAEAA